MKLPKLKFSPFAFLGRINLKPREKRIVTIGGATLAAVLLIGGPIGLEVLVRTRRSEADDTRAALTAVQVARAQIRDRNMRKDAIRARYAKKAPSLAGFLEQTASGQSLQVVDSVDRAEIPQGKRYVERNTVIHFKKSGMGPLARFFEAIETSGYPVAITRLDIRKRPGEVDSFDVEVGVSAYDRHESGTGDDDKKKGGAGGGGGDNK